MDKFGKRVIDALEENGNISKEDKEVYVFALQAVFLYAVNIVLSVIIGMAMGMLEYCLMFLGAFIVLRQDAGGYHAPDWKICSFLSCVILGMTLVWLKISFRYQVYVTFFLALISTAYIFIHAPLETKMKPLDDVGRAASRRRTKKAVIAEMVLGMLLMPLDVKAACAILSSIIWCSGGYVAWFAEMAGRRNNRAYEEK